MLLKIRFFISRLISIIMVRLVNILLVYSLLWFWKMYQLSLFLLLFVLNISFVVISVCQVKVQLIFSLVRIDGSVVGIRISRMKCRLCRLQLCFVMCRVFEILRKLVQVFSVSVQSIECISMKIRLFWFRLNQSSVSGSSVIVGSGLNIVVRVLSRLWFNCVEIVRLVRMKVRMIFSRQFLNSISREIFVLVGSLLLVRFLLRVLVVCRKFGSSRLLFWICVVSFQVSVSSVRISFLCSQFCCQRCWFRGRCCFREIFSRGLSWILYFL